MRFNILFVSLLACSSSPSVTVTASNATEQPEHDARLPRIEATAAKLFGERPEPLEVTVTLTVLEQSSDAIRCKIAMQLATAGNTTKYLSGGATVAGNAGEAIDDCLDALVESLVEKALASE